ncbi:MAG: hypothetical protein N3H30_02820 [Candidatus Micrarchaeota archaeon]|nr:hypothetical protein [Candidatus Micrarchaeota archaeon]
MLVWLGLLALLLILSAAAVATLTARGITKFPAGWHVWLARIGIALALAHATLALLAYV